MAKNDNSTLMIIALGALAAGGYYLFTKNQQHKPTSNTNSGNVSTDHGGFDINRKYPIVWGAYNQDLKELEAAVGLPQYGTFSPQLISALNKYGYYFNSGSAIASSDQLHQILYKVHDYNGD